MGNGSLPERPREIILPAALAEGGPKAREVVGQDGGHVATSDIGGLIEDALGGAASPGDKDNPHDSAQVFSDMNSDELRSIFNAWLAQFRSGHPLKDMSAPTTELERLKNNAAHRAAELIKKEQEMKQLRDRIAKKTTAIWGDLSSADGSGPPLTVLRAVKRYRALERLCKTQTFRQRWLSPLGIWRFVLAQFYKSSIPESVLHHRAAVMRNDQNALEITFLPGSEAHAERIRIKELSDSTEVLRDFETKYLLITAFLEKVRSQDYSSL